MRAEDSAGAATISDSSGLAECCARHCSATLVGETWAVIETYLVLGVFSLTRFGKEILEKTVFSIFPIFSVPFCPFASTRSHPNGARPGELQG